MKQSHFFTRNLIVFLFLFSVATKAQTTLASQDFEGEIEDTWTPAIHTAPYMESNGGDIWKEILSLYSISPKSNAKFWTMKGLNNTTCGGDFNHTLSFPNVSVSGESNVQLSFFYQYNLFYNPWDCLKIEVFFDDVSQGIEEVPTDTGTSSDWTQYTKNVPDGTSDVRFTFSAKHDGANRYAIIDNISLKSNVVLSVKQEGIEGFATYPNPVSNGSFNISTIKNSSRNTQIFDILGKQVYSKQLSTNELAHVEHLNSGVYFLRVEQEGKISIKKIVIKK